MQVRSLFIVQLNVRKVTASRLEYRDEYLSLLGTYYKQGVNSSNIKHAVAAANVFDNDYAIQRLLAHALFVGG